MKVIQFILLSGLCFGTLVSATDLEQREKTRISLEPDQWSSLTEVTQQPNCRHLAERYKVTFEGLKALQTYLEGNRSSSQGLSSLTDFLDEQNRATVVSLSTQRYFQLSQDLDLRSFGMKRSEVELVLVQNARTLERFELDRFSTIPAHLQWEGDHLILSIELDGLDLCQAQKVNLVILSQCEWESKMPTGCSVHGVCEENRRIVSESCQKEVNFEIQLSSIQKNLGIRSHIMKRRHP